MQLEELNKKLLENATQHNMTSNYEKTLLLLAALKSGAVDLADFDLVPGGWTLVMRPPEPTETKPPE